MNDQDLQRIDELAVTFFSVFDNRGQRQPNFSGLKRLFLPEARITRCSGGQREWMSLTDFLEPREAMFRNGVLTEFHEWEIEAQTFVNSVTATRLSKYGKDGVLEGEAYSGAGMKSFQRIRTPLGWRSSRSSGKISSREFVG